MQKQRNFRLIARSPLGTEADIGSNDREFWFYMKRNTPPDLFFCSYDDLPRSQIKLPVQPDWIAEALCVQELNANEYQMRQVRSGVELVKEVPSQTGEKLYKGVLVATSGPLAPVLLYGVVDPVPEVRWASHALGSATPSAALGTLLDPGFDPRCTVVLAGAGDSPVAASADDVPHAATCTSGGEVVVARADGERLLADVTASAAGWLVVQRTWQPQWAASVDGARAPILVADLQRMAIAVPAGRHRVELAVDRRPLHRALAVAALGLLGLLGLALLPLRERRASP